MTLDQFIGKLQSFAQRLRGDIPKQILDELGQWAVDYAKSLVVSVDTGATRDSINYKVERNKLILEAGGNAVWLEFGTGVARNPSEYPISVPGIVGHGEYGNGNGANPNGWYFPTNDIRYAIKDENGNPRTYPDGTYIGHTYGIQANQFMYQTMDAMIDKAAEVGLKLINTELKTL